MTSSATTLAPETLAALADADLDADWVAAVARATVEEDLAGGVDVTSEATVPADLLGTAVLAARAAGVLAGVPVAMAVVDVVAGSAAEHVRRAADGTPVRPGDVAVEVRGPVRALLTAERSALNLLGHLSGIATLTRAWVRAVHGTGAHVRDTRRTTPGLRLLERYAVRCGGGVNDRMALSDAALLTANHIAAAGGVAAAFAAVRSRWPDLEVEVECGTLRQVRAAVTAGADLVRLDAMSLAEMRAAVEACRGAGVLTEASGGLRLDEARAVAETGVDYLAVGALTHSAPALDLGLDLSPDVTPDVSPDLVTDRRAG